MKKQRCAIYTRKSSEEGLEQSFNSLDAQREACSSYVKSQAHEGWVMLPNGYDDGGFSGGNLERPGLKALLADIAAGLIDIVVVYKVDRLTRSLSDFARIIDVLDKASVSFVSVTQSFSTTSSMGRLTLNMLLSFAQFEREVTTERIRDKLAASKAKGMWMGGNVPLGYEPHGRTLIINENEAATVRQIYRLYLQLGCVRRLADLARNQGLRGKIRKGTVPPPFSRGHLYRILSNPLYIGRISHKGQTYPGLHPAIIDAETWAAAQAQLTGNRTGQRTRRNAKAPSLLAGKLELADGTPLTASHAIKAGRRYRYYIARPLTTGTTDRRAPIQRLPAEELERIVCRELADWLQIPDLASSCGLTERTPTELARLREAAQGLAAQLTTGSLHDQIPLIGKLLERVIIHPDQLTLIPNPSGWVDALDIAGCDLTSLPSRHCPLTISRGRGRLQLMLGETQPASPPDPTLTRLLIRANSWWQALTTGRVTSLAALAAAENLHPDYLARLLQLATLAPDIQHAILDGNQPPALSANKLLAMLPLPNDWQGQRRALGFT